MTQEKKQLLLKDLCTRLQYGVICEIDLKPYKLKGINKHKKLWWFEFDGFRCLEGVKPYLRPMSSMTEEEKKEFSIFIGKTETYRQQICLDSDSMCNPTIGGYKCVYWGLFDKCVDWLNAHHFDYRGLIEKGLAIEALEGMY